MNRVFAPMTPAHLDWVADAESRIHLFPWTRGQFADSLLAGHDACLLQEQGLIMGYSVTMNVVDEVHLLNISVLPECQRQGRGGFLLMYLFDVAKRGGMLRMLLEVRQSNIAALALYKGHGFSEIGRRKDYYSAHEGREDALVMAHAL